MNRKIEVILVLGLLIIFVVFVRLLPIPKEEAELIAKIIAGGIVLLIIVIYLFLLFLLLGIIFSMLNHGIYFG